MTIETYNQTFWNEILAESERLIDTKLPELTKKDFYLFKETGNRLIYENAYFGRRKYLTVFGILSQYCKEKKYLEKLENVIDEICNEKFWALPAHVDFEQLDQNTIDLFAAETAQSLAEIIYRQKERMTDTVILRVKEEVLNRVLLPFYESSFPYGWWETDRCNWSAVCTGSVGMAAIYFYRMQFISKECLEACLTRVCHSLECYIAGLEDDGACTEGLGYYSYGMSYFAGFAELYYEETGISLMKADPKMEQVAKFQQKCYFEGGMSVSFSDGSAHENFLPGLTAYLAYNFEDVVMPDIHSARLFHEDACYRWLTNERNISWLKKYEEYITQRKEKIDNFSLLPCAQWMIAKDKRGNGFAIKGGNNEENHNHNDIGSFLCVFEGEMFLTDLGAGEYTKDYFNEKRYTILCNRSLGHSVPLINGQEQKDGKEYRADSFLWLEEERQLNICFESAYTKDIIEKIQRKITLASKEEEALKVELEDEFVCNKNTKQITENLVTTYQPEVSADKVILWGKKGNCSISGFSNPPYIKESEHKLHDGKTEKVYLIQWELPMIPSTVKEKMIIQFATL